METHAKQIIETGPQRAGSGDLPRKLGLLSAIAVLVGTTIGTGIFRSPAGIAQKVPEEGWFLFTWVHLLPRAGWGPHLRVWCRVVR